MTGPSCSATHIPGYINNSHLKSAGKVFVVSVNDPFVYLNPFLSYILTSHRLLLASYQWTSLLSYRLSTLYRPFVAPSQSPSSFSHLVPSISLAWHPEVLHIFQHVHNYNPASTKNFFQLQHESLVLIPRPEFQERRTSPATSSKPPLPHSLSHPTIPSKTPQNPFVSSNLANRP